MFGSMIPAVASFSGANAMFERFTDRARKVMQLANQEAQRFNHEYIGTEHILLGLIREGGGVAVNVLKDLDIDLYRVRKDTENILMPGPDMVTMGKLRQTPRAKKVIEYSIEEARNLNHNYVGTEHLLLGLLREQEGVAAQVLMNRGLKLEEVREEVLNLLGHNMASGESGGRLADVPTGRDLNTALRCLPQPVIQALKEINDRIKKLTEDKEFSIAQQDFEWAAGLQDKEHEFKRKLGDGIKELQARLREMDDSR
jgi:ATP-dependent Clp protease ATP-binding subunit ClpC